jgi:hypothetical protein
MKLLDKQQLCCYSAQSALGTPRCSAGEEIKNWIECKHRTTWNNLPGHGHGKIFISRPYKKKAEDILKLRSQ